MEPASVAEPTRNGPQWSGARPTDAAADDGPSLGYLDPSTWWQHPPVNVDPSVSFDRFPGQHPFGGQASAPLRPRQPAQPTALPSSPRAPSPTKKRDGAAKGAGDGVAPRSKLKKRPRTGHANHTTLPACDTCHIRRVACVRPDPDDPSCDACVRHNILCTNLRQGPRSKQTPQLLALQAQYARNKAKAPANPPNSPTAPPCDQSTASPVEEKPHKRIRLPSLSDDSSEGRLTLAEESESLMARLLESHTQWASFSIPIVHWHALQERFLRAGRRPKQMDVMGQTLALECIALGAMFTDHPLVLGPGAPTFPQLRPLRLPGRAMCSHDLATRDLSEFAGRRSAFCHRLVAQVQQHIDQSGCFRIACPESVVILALAAELMSHSSGRVSWEKCRPYWAGALAHLRALAEQNDAERTERDAIFDLPGMCLMVDDAYRAAHSGTRLCWTDEDLEFLVASVSFQEEHDLEAVLAAIEVGDLDVYLSELATQWNRLIWSTRHFAKQVSYKLAPTPANLRTESWRAVDIGVIAQSLEMAHVVFERMIALRNALRARQVARQPVAWNEGRSSMFSMNSPTCDTDIFVFGVISFVLVVWGRFARWKELRQEATALDPGAPCLSDEAVLIARIEDTATRVLIAAVCFIHGMLVDRKDIAGYELVAHLSVLSPLQYNLDRWTSMAMNLPHAEQGGPPYYPLHLKLEIVDTMIAGLRAQSFTWADRGQAADACELRLQRLAAKAGPPPAIPAGPPLGNEALLCKPPPQPGFVPDLSLVPYRAQPPPALFPDLGSLNGVDMPWDRLLACGPPTIC